MNASSRILIADDEPMVRFTMEALLRPLGLELSFAENGNQAIALAAETSPDLILLDVMMPGMDGFEVCRRLRADPKSAEVPILMVTALDDRQMKLEGIRAGADDFLTKPIDKVELTARLQSVLRLNRYRRLMAERSKFEWLAEQSAEGCLLLGAELTIQYANPKARLLLGLPSHPAEIGEVDFLSIAKRSHRLEPPSAWSLWPKVSGDRVMLVRSETDVARRLWLEVQARPVPAPSGGYVVRLLDVTEQLEHCRDTWKLHSFLSHKLRTPLVGIEGSLEMLSSMAEMDPTGEIAEWVGLAKTSAVRLRGAVTDILQFVEAPAVARAGEGASIGRLAEIATRLATEMSLAAVSLQIPESIRALGLPLSCEGLELVLSEVLGNAKKFHPRKSPAITIAAHVNESREVLIEIRDDGLTLSPAHLSRLGLSFYQAEKRFTGEVAGMGLGLAMVRSIFLEAGGGTSIANQPDGPGVVVTLRLPVRAIDGQNSATGVLHADAHLAPVI